MRTLASASMDEIREALRDGLREEAAPISRRLAEVKGLSNNAIRRLERIEPTLASERDARIDDLALLVELLTEGWRSMNARLDRIEAALEQPRRTSCRSAATSPRLTAAGSTSSNREPSPTSRLEVEPPAERRRQLLRDREPEARAAADCETNGRNSRSRISGGMPGPVSSTATCTVPFRCASSSEIRPPSGVAWNAFESRLPTTWSTRSPSDVITGRARTSWR